MRLRFLLLLFSMTVQATSELFQYRAENEPISESYDEGPFLLYDCSLRSWICVSKANSEACQTKYQAAVLQKKRNLPCVTEQNFLDKPQCFKAQQTRVHQRVDPSLCVGPAYKALIKRP